MINDRKSSTSVHNTIFDLILRAGKRQKESSFAEERFLSSQEREKFDKFEECRECFRNLTLLDEDTS